MLILIASTLLVLSVVMTASHFKKKPAISFLGLSLIIYALEVIMASSFLNWGNASTIGMVLLYLSPLSFLKGPLIYFFIRSFTTEINSIRWRDWWHFIPTVIQFVLMFPSYYLLSPAEKLVATDWMLNAFRKYLDCSGYPVEVLWNSDLRSTILWIYNLVSFILLIRYYRQLKTTSGTADRNLYKWLMSIMAILTSLSTFYIITLLVFVLFKDFAWFYYFTLQSESWITAVFLFVPIILIVQPRLLYHLPDRSASS